MVRCNARPTTDTARPLACAARTIESILATLLAKQVIATRPSAFPITSDKPSKAVCSDGVRPSTIALVESPISANTPSLPISDSFCASVF